MYKLYILYI